jgi:hypothetical protein
MGGIEYCSTHERAAIPSGREALGHGVRWSRDG